MQACKHGHRADDIVLKKSYMGLHAPNRLEGNIGNARSRAKKKKSKIRDETGTLALRTVRRMISVSSDTSRRGNAKQANQCSSFGFEGDLR